MALGSAVLTTGPAPAIGKIQLVDQNVEPGKEAKTPPAEVHVVLPSRLELSCLPADSWTVTVRTEVTTDRLGTLAVLYRALAPGEGRDGVVQPGGVALM